MTKGDGFFVKTYDKIYSSDNNLFIIFHREEKFIFTASRCKPLVPRYRNLTILERSPNSQAPFSFTMVRK